MKNATNCNENAFQLHAVTLESIYFSVFCRTASVVFELDFGLLAFPAGSPLAGADGGSASKTAFTSVNLVNLEWQSLPRVPQFPCIG